METDSSTADNSRRATGRPFKKGDPRINRKGRPKNFDALRSLAQQIAHETAKGDDDGPLVIEGHIVTVAEDIMRQWAVSRNHQLQRAFIEYAFGKVPDNQTVAGTDKPVQHVYMTLDEWRAEQAARRQETAETLDIFEGE